MPNLNEDRYDAILYGYGRFGKEIARHLWEQGYRLMIVDFNPEAVRKCHLAGVEAFYGDASDPDFVAQLPLSRTRWVIATIRGSDEPVTREDPRLSLVDALKRHGFTGRIALTTHQPGELRSLAAEGADLVFLPYRDAAEQASRSILTADAKSTDAGRAHNANTNTPEP